MKGPVKIKNKRPEFNEIPKIIDLPSPNCYVISAENCLVLQSYDTIVAVILPDGSYVQDENQPQSKTTSKHLKAFISKYSPDVSPSYRINLNGDKS